MYSHLPLALFLLLAPSDATFLPRTPRAISSAADRVHRVASKHTVGLARDLRVALEGVLAAPQTPTSVTQTHVYCVSTKSGNGTASSSGHHHGTSTSTHTSTSSAASASASASSSPWKLAESHVSLLLSREFRFSVH